ncbi:MAG: hypothetical protein RI932_1549 [Pseudomonadota bacterium]
MSEKKRILEAIRMRMRRDGVTYAKLAKSLSVSEVSVKRYFSEERLSLDLLDDICRVLGASLDVLLAELKSLAYEQKDTFSEEQEAALAKDEFLFVLFFLVARGGTFDEIDRRFGKKQTAKIVKALRELEELKLLTYPSNTAMRSLVSSNAQIRPGGALWKKYSSVGIQEFFGSDFSAQDEYFKLSLGYISEENACQLKKKLELLEDELKTMLAVEQATTKSGQKKKFYWVANCFRPMDSSVLEVIAEKSKFY